MTDEDKVAAFDEWAAKVRATGDAPAVREKCPVCGLRTTPFGPGEACTDEVHEKATSPGAVTLTTEEWGRLLRLLQYMYDPLMKSSRLPDGGMTPDAWSDWYDGNT